MTLEIPSQFNIASWFIDRPAQEHPDRVAILGAPSEVRYGELSEITNRVANTLKAMGCSPVDRVLIALPDSVEFVATLFAAAKIGAIAVPVNSLAKTEEFQHYLSDCAAKIAVVHVQALPQFLPAAQHRPCELLVVGDQSPSGDARNNWDARIRDASPFADAHPTAATDPALFLYTSGSTGLAKAAVHRHKSMYVTTRSFAQGVLAMGPGDRTLSIPKLFFAFGLGNGMYFPLGLGASTILNPETAALDTVAKLIARYRPTILFAVPTFLRAWFKEMEHGLTADLSSIRLIVYGGEPSPAALFSKYRDTFGIEMIECFGSTEMLQTVLSNLPGKARAGTCGFAVPNYDVKLVGDGGQPVADGETGTLWLKGDSAFQEYWNNPELTAGAKHGDWVVTRDTFYRDPGGYYHFCGRSDDMVKVSGLWVSLPDIEAALCQHSDVEHAVVVPVGEQSASKRLIAYLITRDGREVNSAELRRCLGRQLPEFTMPVAFTRLDELPLTATGKVDRMSLSRMRSDAAAGAGHTDSRVVESCTRTETKLGEIWRTVLDIPDVRLSDDFLDLGGTSVLAMQCVSRIRQELQVDIPIGMFLSEAANLSELAVFIDGMRTNGENSNLDVT